MSLVPMGSSNVGNYETLILDGSRGLDPRLLKEVGDLGPSKDQNQ
jgi:hypothetical protein